MKLQQAARNCIRSSLFRNCLHLHGRSSTVLSSVHHFVTHVMLPRVARHSLRALRVEIFQNFNHTSQRIRSHVSDSVTARNLSSTVVTTSFTPFWRHSLSGLVLTLLLIDSSLITLFPLRFTRSWCFLSGSLRLMSC